MGVACNDQNYDILFLSIPAEFKICPIKIYAHVAHPGWVRMSLLHKLQANILISELEADKGKICSFCFFLSVYNLFTKTMYQDQKQWMAIYVMVYLKLAKKGNIRVVPKIPNVVYGDYELSPEQIL